MRRTLKSGHDAAVRELQHRLDRLPRGGQVPEPLSLRRVRQMIAETDALAEASLVRGRDRLITELLALGASESQFAVAAIETLFPVAYEFNTVPPQLVRSIVESRPMQGELLNDWFNGLSRARQRGISRVVSDGLVNGRSVQGIAREARTVLGTTQRHAETIVRTSVNHVSSHARDEAYKANDDIVQGVQYVAMLDARTTDICMSLDGQVFKVNEGPRPPMHHQCRSTTVPILKPWNDIPGVDASRMPERTRRTLDGSIPASTSYNDWLKTQPVSVQNEALGPGRAELFRAGKISTQDLVDRNYRPLTLEQLRARS